MRAPTAIILGITLFAALPALGADGSDAVARGKYVFDAADCVACHTDTANQGAPLAGGRRLETPFGTFYSPNITPDTATGIGRWSDADFMAALRHGRAPDGSHLYPVFPYPSYTLMSESDMRDLKAYLFSLPPVVRENRPHEVRPPFGWRFLIAGWKALFFSPGAFHPDDSRDQRWNRGAYLATALGHCGECHTPRNAFGAPVSDMALAGTAEGPDGGSVPNITPDRETGIGGWSDDDVDTLLTLGMTPDGDFVGAGMAEVVSNSTSKLTPADRAALIAYLRSLPPINNTVARKAAQ
ncbi:MAG: cytochrome c [Rhodospirillales bacterium]|jgi:mono/diheme cytochrome c family protein|nr:cytochrome c [Rhodospirillales bacterium]